MIICMVYFSDQKSNVRLYPAACGDWVFDFQEVGERIVREELQHKERAEYGKKAIEKLAKDLMISRRLIFDIVNFYRAYQIVHTLCAQLSWSHYRLLSEIKNNMWSKRELERRIKNREYEKARKKGYIVVQLPKQLPAPEDVLLAAIWNLFDSIFIYYSLTFLSLLSD